MTDSGVWLRKAPPATMSLSTVLVSTVGRSSVPMSLSDDSAAVSPILGLGLLISLTSTHLKAKSGAMLETNVSVMTATASAVIVAMTVGTATYWSVVSVGCRAWPLVTVRSVWLVAVT